MRYVCFFNKIKSSLLSSKDNWTKSGFCIAFSIKIWLALLKKLRVFKQFLAQSGNIFALWLGHSQKKAEKRPETFENLRKSHENRLQSQVYASFALSCVVNSHGKCL